MTPREEKQLHELDKHSNELACLTNLREKELQPVSFPMKVYMCSDGNYCTVEENAVNWEKEIAKKSLLNKEKPIEN